MEDKNYNVSLKISNIFNGDFSILLEGLIVKQLNVYDIKDDYYIFRYGHRQNKLIDLKKIREFLKRKEH